MTVELASPKSAGEAGRLKHRQELMFQLLGRIFSPQGKPQFLLLRPSTDWVRPTHSLEGKLYLKSINCVGHVYKTH